MDTENEDWNEGWNTARGREGRVYVFVSKNMGSEKNKKKIGKQIFADDAGVRDKKTVS